MCLFRTPLCPAVAAATLQGVLSRPGSYVGSYLLIVAGNGTLTRWGRKPRQCGIAAVWLRSGAWLQ